jgi:tRNA-dihydrouridine synthase A
MIGRLAYGNPYALSDVDRRFFGDNHPVLSRREILEAYLPYWEQNKDHLSIISTHLLGLFHGQPNAKAYRQVLTSRDWSTIRDFISHL